MFGVCNLSVIPMRASASEKTEMVSQLLFGDAYSVLEENDQWLRIKTFDCDYEGWINKKVHNSIHEKDINDYLGAKKYIVQDYIFFIKEFESALSFPIFIGSSFPYPNNSILILGNSVFTVEIPDERPLPKHDILSQEQVALLQFAAAYIRAPYLWGGRTPAGIDCSGFTQVVFKSIGISLPRDASQQVLSGNTVDFVEEAQVGDLAFFQDEEGNIIHVGVVCGKNRIIHASGKVKIETFDQTGIFSKESESYTHSLRIIKRLL